MFERILLPCVVGATLCLFAIYFNISLDCVATFIAGMIAVTVVFFVCRLVDHFRK